MTKISRAFKNRIQLWEAVKANDGFGGSTIAHTYIKDVWANVRNRNVRNLDTVGSSQNKSEKLITVRIPNLDTNKHIFVINDVGYQINDYVINYKTNQFECLCEATDFVVAEPSKVLLINDFALLINTNNAIILNNA